MKKWTDFSYIVSIPLGTINTKSERHRDLFMNVSIPLGTINTCQPHKAPWHIGFNSTRYN